MTRQRLPAIEEQKRLLKKKGINIGRAKTKSSVYRLYNFYITQKHPKSAPRFQAYATTKRFEAALIASEKPEQMHVRTGTGKRIKAQRLIRTFDKESREDFNRALPPNVTFQYGKTYKTVDKIRDQGIYLIEPPIRATVMTLDQAQKRAQLVTDDLIAIVHAAQRTRGRFYKDYSVGGKIIARGKHFQTDEGLASVDIVIPFPWTGLYREDFLFQRTFMDQGFNDVLKTLNNVSAQENAVVIIERVEIKFSTNRRPSNVDRLRV